MSGARGGGLEDATLILQPARDEDQGHDRRDVRLIFSGGTTPVETRVFLMAVVHYTGNRSSQLRFSPLQTSS